MKSPQTTQPRQPAKVELGIMCYSISATGTTTVAQKEALQIYSFYFN